MEATAAQEVTIMVEFNTIQSFVADPSLPPGWDCDGHGTHVTAPPGVMRENLFYVGPKASAQKALKAINAEMRRLKRQGMVAKFKVQLLEEE